MYRLGMLVTLIDRRPFQGLSDGEVQPSFGVVYTIRDMEIYNNHLGLVFEELRNPDVYSIGVKECSFLATRFRPVSGRVTDISILRALLKTKDVSAVC